MSRHKLYIYEAFLAKPLVFVLCHTSQFYCASSAVPQLPCSARLKQTGWIMSGEDTEPQQGQKGALGCAASPGQDS